MSTAALMECLRARGLTLIAEDRAVRVRPASALTPADREAIRADLPALLAILAPPDSGGGGPDRTTEVAVAPAGNEPWESRDALRLMEEADAAVEWLMVDGRDPEISRAAARVASAYSTRDLETVRIACGEFGIAVREVAGRVRQRR